MSQPLQLAQVVSLVSLAVLCVLALRKLALMEGLHWLRVTLFTLLLWLPVLYAILFFILLPMRGGCCCTIHFNE